MEKKIIFIFGCQRSGTTATIDGLSKNKDIFVFNEINESIYKKTKEKHLIRLKPRKEVIDILNGIEENNIILKPLVESQNAADLLKEFPNSRAFWLIREYRNVAKSMMKKWTRKIGFDFLMKSSIEGTWQSEKINDLRPLLNSIKIKNLSNWDYTCLFWYVRNYHFYKQSLDTNNKVLLLHYDHLIRDLKYLQTRFDMLNLNLNISSDFYEQKSARTFKNINLNPLINQLCSDMWSRLNSDHKRSI